MIKKYIALFLALVLTASCCMGVSAQAIAPITQEFAGQLDLANENIDFDDLVGKVKPTSIFFPTFTFTEKEDGRWVEDADGKYYHYDWVQYLTYQVKFSNGKAEIFSGPQFTHQGKQYNLTFTDPQSFQTPWTAGNTYKVPVSVGNVSGTLTVKIKPLEGLPGDCNGDEKVNNDDVRYLLWHTLFPDRYNLDAYADFTKDNQVSNDDVIYLLWHTLFEEAYPL